MPHPCVPGGFLLNREFRGIFYSIKNKLYTNIRPQQQSASGCLNNYMDRTKYADTSVPTAAAEYIPAP